MYYENEYSLLLILVLIIANMLFALKNKFSKIIIVFIIVSFIFCIIHLGIPKAIATLFYGVFISFCIPSTLLIYITKMVKSNTLKKLPKDRSNFVLKEINLTNNRVRICKDGKTNQLYSSFSNNPKQYALDHARYFRYIDKAYFKHKFALNKDRTILTEKESIRKYVLSDKPYVYILKKKK